MAEIMEALFITSRAGFYKRLDGKVEPTVREQTAIERVFAKRKISKSNVWGSAVTETITA